MPASKSKSQLKKANRKQSKSHAAAQERTLQNLEPRRLLSAAVSNPPPVQTYYLPTPAASVLQALQTIHSGPTAPISTFTSIAIAEDGTEIYYNQWETGYVADIANPTASQIYNATTNPGGVQIWGDGNTANGSAPGDPSDVLQAGQVILLQSPSITVPRNPSQIYFDGGDKIAATKSVAIGELNWAAGTSTLLAGAVQVTPVSTWGTNYTVPIGQNTSGNSSMFSYTGLSIMAAKDGTTVQIDTDGNGTIDKTITLNQGQNYLVNNGVKQGARVISTDSSKPIQVDIITGNPSQTYASRWFNLAPITSWSNSYYTSVSTPSSNSTVVFLYNPSSTAITVTEQTRGSAGTAATLTTTTISVPAKGSAHVTIPQGSGAHFYTVGGQSFYAVSTSDYGSYNYDWGMSLIPQDQLTTQALVGLGFGRDPTSTVKPTENGSPVWVTPVGNGNTPVTVYVSYNGDNSGPLVDPNGFHYDVALSLKELQTAKVFNPSGNQSGMLLYTLNPNVKLAVSWGEDPASASVAAPGIDAGTNIAPLQEYDAGKSASLLVDANGDGVVSPGDTLQYTIVVNNISRASLSGINVLDNLPSSVSYIPGTVSYTITPHDGTALAPVLVTDSGTTLFPLDESGFNLPMLAGGSTLTLTFDATILNTLPTGLTDILNTGFVTDPGVNGNVPIQADTPVQYDASGLVFQDTNRNGAVDAGEPGLAGVTVNLLSGNTIVSSATTDSNGHYLFIGVPLGNYTVSIVNSSVQAVLPNAVQFAGVDPSALTISGGGAVTDAGIDGFMTLPVSAPPSALTGHVTVDGNGLSGVAITLTGTTDKGAITPVTVMTSSDGSYAFTGLVAGNYTISEAQPSGLLDGADFSGSLGGTVAPIPGDQISAITVPAGAAGTNYNFTELTPATSSGFVYTDSNNNGIMDGSEIGIGGVSLTITGTNDLGTITPITITTASDGSYSFTGLRPGNYTITETQPTAYLDGLDSLNGTVIAGSNTTDTIAGLTLGSGTHSVNDNFGELPPGVTSGFVYGDKNDNGAKDSSETGIAGVTLTLTGTSDLGPIAPITAVTASDGSYSFGTLRPGNYTITETQPAGFLDGLDSSNGVVIAGSNASDVISGLTVLGSTIPNNNFGELVASSASGVVYADTNNNGSRDSGETGIGGVTLTLSGTSDLGTITPITVTTAADGSYSFGTLRPGTYTITEVQPAGYLDGLDAKNGSVISGSKATDAITGLVTLYGTSLVNNNFGEILPATASGFVYADSNDDGIKEIGETGIGGVTLTITGSNDLGTITPITVTTAVDGSYSFGNLRPGTYTITETQPAGYLDGLDAKNGVVIAGSATTDLISGITVSSNGISSNDNFGELISASASGTVFLDSNDNGIQDTITHLIGGSAEAGLAGVQLTLTGTNDLGAITPITITTAADGSYSFNGLRPGTYTITETQPAGYLDGFDAKESVVIPGSNTTDVIPGIVLVSGESTVNTFGEILPSSASGIVYSDTNDNGVMDSGETPIAGVKLTITGTNDIGVITPITVTTGIDGTYNFGTLRPGNYTITETQPIGYFDGLDSNNGVVIPGSNATDTITGLSFSSGTTSTSDNFGELSPSSANGFVYADANNNGIKDAGETGISGVTLTLTGSNDLGTISPVTVTTASDGSYSFGNLRPGTYTITETQPSGYVDGLDSANGVPIAGSNTTDAITGLTISAAAPSLNDSFGELRPGIKIVTLTNGTNNDSAPVAGTPDGPSVVIGSTVTWTYLVTDTGIEGNTNIVVTDNNGTPGNTADDIHPAYTSGDTNNNGILDAGETWTYTATGIALAGQYENVGTVTATGASSNLAVTNSNVDHYFGMAMPAINIVKTASKDFVAAGSPETFTYTVTSNGDAPVANVNVVDDNATPGNTADDFHPTYVSGDTNHNSMLDANETWIYTATTTTPTLLNLGASTSIQSDFNGTSIAYNPVAGQSNYIWFNSDINVKGLSTTQPTTVYIKNQTITFSYTNPITHALVTQNLAVPNAQITFTPGLTTATTTFSNGTWITNVPTSGLAGNLFMAGLAFKIPVGGLPGGINPVTWNASISTNTPGVSAQWQWAAAVYNNFTSNYNNVGVKPVDDNQASSYKNSDHAGTPENYTLPGILPGGARGGGGSNWTGSYSGTASVAPSTPTPQYLTNIATVTGTATVGSSMYSVRATASATIDVVSSLGNAINSAIKASNTQISGNAISFTLTNTSATAQAITELNMIWPAANGNLNQISAGSNVLYATSTSGPDADITAFLGLASTRTIAAGQSITLTFTFANAADATASDYGFLIALGNAAVLI